MQTTPQPAPQPDQFILRVDTYENHLGQRLFERVVVSGTPPPTFHRFIGAGQLNVPDSPAGPIHQPYNFVLEADSVERAFELFEAAAQAEGRRVLAMIASQLRQQMMAVQPMDPKVLKLLDSSGNPLRRSR